MSLIQLPVANDPESVQTFTIANVNYGLRLRYNERATAWFVDLLDEDENVLVAGRKVVVNWPVIGARETDPDIFPGWLFAFDTSDIDLDPTVDDMGTRVVLMYMEPE